LAQFPDASFHLALSELAVETLTNGFACISSLAYLYQNGIDSELCKRWGFRFIPYLS